MKHKKFKGKLVVNRIPNDYSEAGKSESTNITEEASASNNYSKDNGYRPISKYIEQRVSSAIMQAEVSPKHKRSIANKEPFLYNKETNTYDNICNGRYGKVLLKVRKGKLTAKPHYCASCLKYEKPIWRYQDSNYGIIYLCSVCKAAVLERSFGYSDAMPLKVDHAYAHKGKW